MLAKPVETTKTFQGYVSQAEANYVPLSPNLPTKACANCRWFMNDGCFIVESYPEPIISTGYSDRWEAMPERPAELAEEIAEAVGEAVETIVDNMPVYVEMSKKEPNVFEKLLAELKAYLPQKEQSDLQVFKGKDGKPYWLATFTNNFKDLDGEIISEKAHKEYEMRLDMKLTPMPELWAWHTEGTKHGVADMVWYQDHNQYAIGHFDDTPEATKAIKYYSKHAVKLSHGFVAPTWAFKDGVYDAYNTFEISTLPPQVAANPYTSFEEIKSMPVPEKREAFITELFGASASDVLAKVNARNDQAKELATLVEFKDFASPTEGEEKPVEVSKAFGELFTENVDITTELLKLVKAQAEALKAKDTSIAAIKTEKDTEVAQLQADIKQLQTIVNAPPGRASQSPATLRKESDGLTDKTPQKPDDFFGDLFTPAPNGANR